jgi:hypothetical protein
MNTDALESFTQSQLTRARAADFCRFLALQTKFSGDPDPEYSALRNFPVHFPRSMNLSLFEKAAVSFGTTLDSTFAGPLAPLRQLSDAFLELLRPATLIGRIPGLRQVPFQVSISAQTAGSAFSWLAEGAAAPATKADFSTVTVGRAKVGGVAVVTKELAQLSSPSAVALMQRDLIAGCKQFLDSQFIDPAVAGVANVTPASITNGAGTSASAGSLQVNAETDWQLLTSTFLANNPDSEDMVVLMTGSNAMALSRALNLKETLGYKGGSAFGVPVITSGTVGNRLIALDASQILLADEGDMEVTASTSALVQMDTVPAEPTVASTILISLFQRNLVGFKIVKMVNWVRARSTAVHYISGANYV